MKVEEFIFKWIPSVDHLRALLLLHGAPEREWEEVEICGRLYIEPRRVAAVLESLVGSGLVRRDDSSGRYRFVPPTGKAAELLEQVVLMDRERPVSLIRLIYSRPSTLEAFSDAFRLRRNQ